MIYVLIREGENYPGAVVLEGFRRLGIPVLTGFTPSPRIDRDSWVLSWSLWSHQFRFRAVQMVKARGGRAVVCENGIIPRINGERFTQACYDLHNGGGSHRIGGPERWRSWGIQLRPWREPGGYVLICAQRGTRPNDPHITHGPDWTEDICRRIRAVTDRPIRLRPHPGNDRPCLPRTRVRDFAVLDPRQDYSEHLRGAHVVIVYSSTAANQALIEGVPVIYDGPHIALREACSRDLATIENRFMGDRETAFERAAWMQWSDSEWQTGKAWSWISGI